MKLVNLPLKLFMYISLSMIFFYSCKKNKDLDVTVETPKKTEPLNKDQTCFLFLPPELGQKTEFGGLRPNGVLLNAYRWQTGQTVRVKFLNGSPFLQSKVQQFANQWMQHANLIFQYVGINENADIKIAFQYNGDGGSWSYYGTVCQQIAQDKPSMNFGWFTESTSDAEFSRTTIHEFGHALSMGHEQSHPANTIQWNKPVVYAYYAQYGWSQQMVDDNVFNRFSTTETSYSAYDPSSIMHYPIPANHTLNGFSVGYNNYLSETDKNFISQMYPFPQTNKYILYGGEQLLQNEFIKSPNGIYTLIMQGDGNLVLYKYGTTALWHTNTWGKPWITKCIMQTDGHLVLYDDSWNYYWYSGTAGYNGAYLVMQDDGNLVIYQNGIARWASNTAGL
jgi:hypothetical protein